MAPLLPGKVVSYGRGLLPRVSSYTERTRRVKPKLEVRVLSHWLIGDKIAISETEEAALRAVKRVNEVHFATKASSQQWCERRGDFRQLSHSTDEDAFVFEN